MSSRAVAPLPHRRRIPMPAIHNVVQQVAAHFQPEKARCFMNELTTERRRSEAMPTRQTLLTRLICATLMPVRNGLILSSSLT